MTIFSDLQWSRRDQGRSSQYLHCNTCRSEVSEQKTWMMSLQPLNSEV
jgi:hypothetical protein